MRAMLLALLVGCQAPLPHADQVVSAPGALSGLPFDDPQLAANGVRAGGQRQGSTDVYSLDLDGPRTELVLAFTEVVVVDGEGPDLVVFENPFEIDGGGVFIDPVSVEVSEDGDTFVAFPYGLKSDGYSMDPDDWWGIAGRLPGAHDLDDPSSPSAELPEAGGDRFDLADLGLTAITHVRLRPAAGMPVHSASNGPDIDGVIAINVEESR